MTEEKETTQTITEDMIPDFEVEVGDAEITKERLLSAARAVFVIITTIATMLGFEVDLDFWYQIFLVVLMGVSIVVAYWKNNNITKNAVIAQQVKKGLTNETSEVNVVSEEDKAE